MKSYISVRLRSFFVFRIFIYWLRWVFVASRGLFSSCRDECASLVVCKATELCEKQPKKILVCLSALRCEREKRCLRGSGVRTEIL